MTYDGRTTEPARLVRVLRAFEVLALIAAPVCLAIAAYWQVDQSALLTMVVVLVCVSVFFAEFEVGRPKLRQIMPIVVLAALAAAGRILFVMLPNIQPATAIVILSGVVFGRRSGFMTGALMVLVSNLFLGQGPWTPWQMYSFGLVGYVAGVFCDKGVFENRVVLYVFGLLAPIACCGFILNTWYLIGYVHPITLPAAIVTYTAGFSMDIAHGVSTAIFLLVLYAPWRLKLERIKRKYELGFGGNS